MSQHPSDDDLERFLAARVTPAEQQGVVRHLLAGCGACSRKLVERAPRDLLHRLMESRRQVETRDSALTCALADALRQNSRWKTDERELARSLEALDSSTQDHGDLSFEPAQARSPAHVEILLRESFELRFRDLKKAKQVAFRALKVAESLRSETYGAALLSDIQAKAWAGLANTFKINEEYIPAEAAFRKGQGLLRQGTGDLRLLARLAELEASLRVSQRRLAEARELLDRIFRLYVKLGDTHLAGQTAIAKGNSMEHDDRSHRGLPLLQKGLSLIDPDRDPLLVGIGQQAFINALARSGQYLEASKMLLRSGLRQAFSQNSISLLKIRWVEGRILTGLGKSSSAERALLDVKNSFWDLGMTCGAALVGLDLLPLYSRQGRSSKVREISTQSYEVFRDLDYPREAAKAESYLY
jgi:tetratricopeptide (TPR) repeat protein